MKYRFASGLGAGVVTLMTLWTTAAFAHDAPSPASGVPQAQTKPAEPAGFQDIVVTARRRVERLQDVPVAATAFTSEQLARYQTNSLQQIASQVPQLQIGDTGSTGGGVINLRGVGSPSAGPTIDQAVSINVDGIQFSQAEVLRLGLYDLDSIDVLKGPQALFYGKNSPAGVISITSKGPGDKLEASLRGGYEFANQRKYVEGMVSGPLTDTLGARIDVAYGNQNGWFRNDAKPIPAVLVPPSLRGTGQSTDAGVGSTAPTGPDQRDITLRGTLAYKAPGGFVDGTLKVSYGRIRRDNGIGYDNQLAACPGGASQFVLALGNAGSRDCTLNRYYNESNIPAGVLAKSPVFGQDGGKQFYFNNQFLASGTLNFHLADHLTLTSVTGYYDLKERLTGDFAFGDLDFVNQYGTISIKQFSQELRLLSSYSSPLNFSAGAYYQHVNIDQTNFSVFGSPLIEAFTGGKLQGYQIAVDNNERQKTQAYSFFGQAILDLSPQIQLTAGGRYSHEKKDQSGDSLAPQVFLASSLYNVPFLVPSLAFSNFSPEVTATYKPMRSLTFYAAYRTGFKSGGFDLNSGTLSFGATHLGTSNSFGPEKAKGFEVGAKGNIFNRQLLFDFSAYRYIYSNLQVSAFDASTLGYRITNAASAKIQGVELAAQYRPQEVPGLSLRGTISYNDARYEAFGDAPCYVGQSIAAGCSYILSGGSATPIAAGQVGKLQNLTGQKLTRAPAWSGNIGGTYEYSLPGNLTLSASADGIYTGSYYAEPSHDPRAFQQDAWRLDASLSLRGPKDRWEVALIGTNLTQQIRAVNGFGLVGTGTGTGTANAVPNNLVESPSQVRTVSLQATIKY